MTTADSLVLSASLEDYLEAILQIVKDKQAARAKDIGQRLKVGRSSVTGALRALADRHLINYAPYDIVTLTPTGRALAEQILRRHEVLTAFFVKALSIPAGEAEETACKMEHAVSERVLERFVEFVEFLERCPRGGAKWSTGLGYSCEHDKTPESCQKCLEAIQEDLRRQHMTQVATPQVLIALDTLKPGEKATIARVTGSGGISRRLLDMGATTGTLVEVERVAPLGDPMEVKIRGYHLTLRHDEAGLILVSPRA